MSEIVCNTTIEKQQIICTLTSPFDAVEMKRGAYVQSWDNPRKLEGDALRAALCVLPERGLLKFDMRETRFCDPAIPGQSLALVSFVPARGAQPDARGIFGFAKIRGTFSSDVDSRVTEERLIEGDSYHPIQTVRVGQPFPLVTSAQNFAAENIEVDVREEAIRTISQDVKKKRNIEKQNVETILQREKNLLEKSKRNLEGNHEPVEDDLEDQDLPLEKYTTLRMKKAQLLHAYMENKKKLDEVKERVYETLSEIAKIDQDSPEFKENYKRRIASTRQAVGMETDFSSDSFLQYLGDDFDLETIFGEQNKIELGSLHAKTSLRDL
jgi:hypothetical protein